MMHRRAVGPIIKVIGGYAFDQRDETGTTVRSAAYHRITDATYARAWEKAHGAELTETEEDFVNWR